MVLTDLRYNSVYIIFSAFEGDASELDLGDEVEYSLARKLSKVSAETIRKLPKGTVAQEVRSAWDNAA